MGKTNKTHQHISKVLKEHRVENGWTQVQLAEKAGINQNAYAKIERQEQKASIDTLEKLAKALKLDSKDILPF